MEILLPLVLFCFWHLLVLGVGVWIGSQRPWRWRIVRDGSQGDMSRNGQETYDDIRPFEQVRR